MAIGSCRREWEAVLNLYQIVNVPPFLISRAIWSMRLSAAGINALSAIQLSVAGSKVILRLVEWSWDSTRHVIRSVSMKRRKLSPSVSVLRKARRGDSHIKNFGDAGAYCPLIFRFIAENHIVGHNATLTVGRIGQVV